MAKKEQPCWVCGQQTMVKDVAEERRIFPSGKYEIMCKGCNERRVDDAIHKRRKELGLHDDHQ